MEDGMRNGYKLRPAIVSVDAMESELNIKAKTGFFSFCTTSANAMLR